MRIRRFRPADAEAVAACFHDSVRELGPLVYSEEQVVAWSPGPADPASIEARCADGRLVLVATDDDGRVLGFGELERNGHIDRLYRRPDAPRGVGAALVDSLIAAAKGQGLKRLSVEASELARPVFERVGFRTLERQDVDRGGVAIHNYAMIRHLTY